MVTARMTRDLASALPAAIQPVPLSLALASPGAWRNTPTLARDIPTSQAQLTSATPLTLPRGLWVNRDIRGMLVIPADHTTFKPMQGMEAATACSINAKATPATAIPYPTMATPTCGAASWLAELSPPRVETRKLTSKIIPARTPLPLRLIKPPIPARVG